MHNVKWIIIIIFVLGTHNATCLKKIMDMDKKLMISF